MLDATSADPTQTSAQRISVRKMFGFLYLFLCPCPVGRWPTLSPLWPKLNFAVA